MELAGKRRPRRADATLSGISVPPTSDEALRLLLDGWSATGSRTWLQVAADGRWEDARGLDLPADPGAVRSLVREAGSGDVAVEYEWIGHRLVFVGARRDADDDEASFEDAVARVAHSRPSDPAVALDGLSGGAPWQLGHVELGAANAWKSVGPLRLWTRGDGRAAGSIERLLSARPGLARCARPVALELAFAGPRECWLGVEVSRPSGDGHVVEAPAVEVQLDRLFAGSGP